jgi:hypothetical protein
MIWMMEKLVFNFGSYPDETLPFYYANHHVTLMHISFVFALSPEEALLLLSENMVC